MTARLIVIDGPHHGEQVSLEDAPITIGRDTSTHISLDDALVSRQHSVVEEVDEGYRIRDLDSRNGMIVNDVPVTERLLEHGDRIRIGTSTILFLVSDDPGVPLPRPADVSTDIALPVPFIHLKPDDSVYLRPDQPAASPYLTDQRSARDFGALMRLGVDLNSCRDVATLSRLLAEGIRDSVPAERGAFLLRGETGDAFESLFEWNGDPDSGLTLRVSQTVVDYVLLEGVAVLAKDVGVEELFGCAEGKVATGVRSVLAVPLVTRGERIGVVYLESGDEGTRFDERSLHFVSALAEIGAVAIENARHVERLEEEIERLRGKRMS